MGFFVPAIETKYKEDKVAFHYRMACLMSLSSVMHALKKDQIVEKIVPVFETAAKDHVPNVRFALARILKEQKHLIPQEVWSVKIEPHLK